MPVSADSARIRNLPPVLASQIAAGEVIERPASVVKELVENSLDAGARHIHIDIEAAGSRLIRVRDDGHGIHAEDLALAPAPHSTSKVRRVEDLAAIHSLGFRGEALASIAAVARLRIVSTRARAWGREITVEPGADVPPPAPAAHPQGTTIEVRDLFFNVPARRKFLRTEQTEFLHILELVKALGLSRPALGLKLHHNGRQVFSLRAGGGLPDRLAAVFGRGFAARASAIEEAAGHWRIHGVAGRPEAARSQADRQYLFLNGRLIRDRRLNHALRLAYSDSLAPGRYAPLLVYLEMDAADYDINVHPTKHEVRFRSGRDVHDFLYSALRRSLAADQPVSEPAARPLARAAAADDGPVRQATGSAPSALAEPATGGYARAAAGPDALFGDYLTCLERYLICRREQALTVVDAARTLAGLTWLDLEQGWQASALTAQPLLLPQTQTVPAATTALVEQWQQALAMLGIRLDATSPTQVALRALPRQMPASGDTLLSVLLAALAEAGPTADTPPPGARTALFNALAEHAAASFAAVLEREPPERLLQRLAHAVDNGTWTAPYPWQVIDAVVLADWLQAR